MNNFFTGFIYVLSYAMPTFSAMESADSSEIVKDSPKTLLLVGVLVGLLGTLTLGLIGALIIMTRRRRRQSENEPSLLVHDE